MNKRTYKTFQALLMAVLGLALFGKMMDGTILYYINRRYILLIFLAAVCLLMLAQLALRQRTPVQYDEKDGSMVNGEQMPFETEARDASRIIWLAVPVLMAILMPSLPLGSSAVEQRGINTSAVLTSQTRQVTSAVEIKSEERNILDWVRVFSTNVDIKKVLGQPADLVGFIYHDSRLTNEYFMLGRFAVTCCVADATALGIVVQWPEALDLEDNQWVRVRGKIALTQSNGQDQLMVKADEVKIVPEPLQPYLFP